MVAPPILAVPARRDVTGSMTVARRPPPRPVSGPVLFARYAFGPNRLGYCGPDAVAELFGETTGGRDERALRELARGFDGAWPYLELIAAANGLPDPLDRRVVEAYWLGSDLLRRVPPARFAASLDERFRPRARNAEWSWLAGTVGLGGVPVHAFHVFDVFPRIGLLRTGSLDGALDVMDACRIRWGRVIERVGDRLLVEAAPLEMHEGRLVLGRPRPESVEAWRDGVGFVDDIEPGEMVAVHWSWACDRLSVPQLAGLRDWTQRQLDIANLTI
ncbi:MAG: DUF6390 family protein [Candidatus Limnocylindrales bacterium]